MCLLLDTYKFNRSKNLICHCFLQFYRLRVDKSRKEADKSSHVDENDNLIEARAETGAGAIVETHAKDGIVAETRAGAIAAIGNEATGQLFTHHRLNKPRSLSIEIID